MREKLPCINSMNTSCNIVAGLSIVICTWNRAESLRVTLGSLNEQLPCDSHSIEVLVIDNNSSDHTKQVVDEALGTWRFGTLRYAFESRQGKQFALNHGINLCTYDVIAFTDDNVARSIHILSPREFSPSYRKTLCTRCRPFWRFICCDLNNILMTATKPLRQTCFHR